MDLKQLEGFVKVALLGSYTKASIVMSVSQPTLSRYVRQLEVELSHHLFNRTGRGVALTEEGALFLTHAQAILAQHERALQDLRQVRTTPVGNVIVGAPPFVGRMLTMRLVTTFRKRFPKASLEIMEGKSWIIHEWLLTGRIDIGVWYNPTRSAHMDVTPLVEKEQLLVSARSIAPRHNTAVEFRHLPKFPLILPSPPNTQRILIEALAAKSDVELDIALQIDGANFILELVHQGHGHTILPKYIVEESPLSSTLRMNRIVNPSVTTMLSLAVLSERPMSRLAQETVKLVKSLLGRGSAFASR